MSSCMVCHLDSKKHSKKMWALHQQAQICAFCKKNASEHSEKLWQMHEFAVEKGQRCPTHCKNETHEITNDDEQNECVAHDDDNEQRQRQRTPQQAQRTILINGHEAERTTKWNRFVSEERMKLKDKTMLLYLS